MSQRDNDVLFDISLQHHAASGGKDNGNLNRGDNADKSRRATTSAGAGTRARAAKSKPTANVSTAAARATPWTTRHPMLEEPERESSGRHNRCNGHNPTYHSAVTRDGHHIAHRDVNTDHNGQVDRAASRGAHPFRRRRQPRPSYPRAHRPHEGPATTPRRHHAAEPVTNQHEPCAIIFSLSSPPVQRRMYLRQFSSIRAAVDDNVCSMSVTARRCHKTMHSPTTHCGHRLLPQSCIHRPCASLRHRRARGVLSVRAHPTSCTSSIGMWLNCVMQFARYPRMSCSRCTCIVVPQHHSFSGGGLLLAEV
jgi:hypothetical protein